MAPKRATAAAPVAETEALNKGNRYKYGDGNDTDDFLQGVVGGKPKSRYVPPPAETKPSEGSESGVSSNYYSPRHQLLNDTKVCGIAYCRSRALMMTVAIFLMAGGAALIALLVKRESFLVHLWPLSFYSMNALGGIYILSSLVGIGAVVLDDDTWRRATLFLLCFATAGVCLGFGLVTSVKLGKQDGKLLSQWENNVRDNEAKICDIENALNCSGWTYHCPQHDTENTSATGLSAAIAELSHLAAEWGSSSGAGNSSLVAQCVFGCLFDHGGLYHNYNKTCAAALQDDIDRDYPIAIGVMAACILWTVLYASIVILRRDVPRDYGGLLQA